MSNEEQNKSLPKREKKFLPIRTKKFLPKRVKKFLPLPHHNFKALIVVVVALIMLYFLVTSIS